MSAAELRVGAASLTADSLLIDRMTPADGDSLASVHAAQNSSGLSVAYNGHGVAVVADKTPVVRVQINGTVTSEIEVNTETGEWVVVRKRMAGKEVVKSDRTSLIPAL